MNTGFRPIATNIPTPTVTNNNPTSNQASSFSMNIGSKKGSAFNNLRTVEPEKN